MAITRLSTIVVTLMVAVAAWGAGDDTETPKGITLTADEQALVAGNNGFAFRLFQQARSQTESVVLSPLSITFALGMMNNGAAADSQTCREICQVLGFGEAGAGAINAFCHKMLTESGTLDELTKVLIANNIYVNSYLGYRLMPAFTDKVVQNYEAVPETRDFTDGETLNVINKWASDHTEGMIEEALHPDEFDPMTISCLLNALYFKGEWTHKFDAQLTQEEPFNDFKTTVQMMQQDSEFYYADNDVFQSIILPYGNKAYQMNVYLPHEGKDIDDVLEFLKGNSWTANDIYRTFHPKTMNFTFFSSAHGTFSRIDHILGHKASLGKLKNIEIIPSIFSDHNAVRLDLNYRRKTIKNSNIWRLNNTLLNNQQITEEIKKEIKICIEMNENENTTTQNLWDTVKAVLRGKFIAIQAHLKKQEKSQINNLTLHLKQLEKEEMKNPRVSRRKEILKIRAEINAKETKETIAKINKETQTLNDTVDQVDLIYIYRTFHPKTINFTFFSSAHGTFSRIDHILSHKSSLGKFKKIEIIPSIFMTIMQ